MESEFPETATRWGQQNGQGGCQVGRVEAACSAKGKREKGWVVCNYVPIWHVQEVDSYVMNFHYSSFSSRAN